MAENRTLTVGQTYLYNDVPVKIVEFFEIKLDTIDIPQIEKYTENGH